VERNKENKYNIFSAEEYVELVKAVSKKIKAVNPEANIIAGSFNIIGNDRTGRKNCQIRCFELCKWSIYPSL
jgi:hypothetical protein